jgi:hypothetical protein
MTKSYDIERTECGLDISEASEALANARKSISELMAYLETSKFQGPENDYVQISTDIFPKLREIRTGLMR